LIIYWIHFFFCFRLLQETREKIGQAFQTKNQTFESDGVGVVVAVLVDVEDEEDVEGAVEMKRVNQNKQHPSNKKGKRVQASSGSSY
jgi:hypothetical protein